MRVYIMEESVEVTHDVVICGVNGREETGCAPSTTYDDHGLLLRVERQLWAGVFFSLCDIVESPGSSKDSNKCCATQNLQKASPS